MEDKWRLSNYKLTRLASLCDELANYTLVVWHVYLIQLQFSLRLFFVSLQVLSFCSLCPLRVPLGVIEFYFYIFNALKANFRVQSTLLHGVFFKWFGAAAKTVLMFLLALPRMPRQTAVPGWRGSCRQSVVGGDRWRLCSNEDSGNVHHRCHWMELLVYVGCGMRILHYPVAEWSQRVLSPRACDTGGSSCRHLAIGGIVRGGGVWWKRRDWRVKIAVNVCGWSGGWPYFMIGFRFHIFLFSSPRKKTSFLKCPPAICHSVAVEM